MLSVGVVALVVASDVVIVYYIVNVNVIVDDYTYIVFVAPVVIVDVVGGIVVRKVLMHGIVVAIDIVYDEVSCINVSVDIVGIISDSNDVDINNVIIYFQYYCVDSYRVY